MPNYTIQQLNTWLDFRNYTLKDFIAEHKITNDQIQDDSKKYKLEGLVQIFADHLFAHVYFYPSGKFAIMNIYGEGLEPLSADDLLAAYGKPEAQERSRAGKTSNYAVYATKGFAFSHKNKDNEVHYLDLFPSMPTTNYIETIYLPPGPFIR